MSTVWLSNVVLMLSYDSSIPCFFRCFLMEKMNVEFCEKDFSKSIEVIMWFLSIYVIHYIYCFAYIKPPPCFWNETNLVMMNNFSDVLWVCFANILLRILKISVHWGYCPVIFFLFWLYLALPSEWWHLCEEFWNISRLSTLWSSWRSINKLGPL